ncbi:hypothetical protein ACLOJK_031198 [Asimina triloba]
MAKTTPSSRSGIGIAVGLTEPDMAAAKQLFLLRRDVTEEEEEDEEDGCSCETKRAITASLEEKGGGKATWGGGFRGRKRFRSIDYIYRKTEPLNVVRHLKKNKV